jgi:hypothetical protein
MLQKILKALFPGTIASIEKQAVEQYCFDIIEIERISQFGSLAAYEEHVKEINALHEEMYQQELRDRAYTDELHYLYQDETEAEYVTRIAQEEEEALYKAINSGKK